MHLLHVGGEPCLHRGDSISALTWTQKGTVRSDVALKPALLFGVYVTLHLPHEKNTRMDIISRGGTWADVWMEDQRFYNGSLPKFLPLLDLQPDPILRLVDPRSPIDTDDIFCLFFNKCVDFCK